ncbi:predicted protein [Plenodomus lingam JN3]|uniref:Uncharacterized protein n=1 Tax=Leptosphaeria maculans (strain JN3 / isolate v23.1.3 / race Av1-4-5-6-7-8) TaxID=985895 RepID=M1ZJP2_LEPMJ|nr:predicted protein [Plenodomus lingam JN3]
MRLEKRLKWLQLSYIPFASPSTSLAQRIVDVPFESHREAMSESNKMLRNQPITTVVKIRVEGKPYRPATNPPHVCEPKDENSIQGDKIIYIA